jgi:predicted O-methyltransferase YrrM
MKRSWIERAIAAGAPGLTSGLLAAIAASLPFAAVAGVAVALGSVSPGEAVLGTLAVFLVTGVLTVIVISRVRSVHRDVIALRGDLPAIVGLAPLGSGYPLPLGGSWAMAPDGLAELARVAAERRPNLILELGSGVSTLILGLTLKRLGHGRLVSYDHAPEWAEQTRQRVKALGLDKYVTVIDAPLADVDVEGTTRRWYDLAGTLPRDPIDMLVVDGPPSAHQADWAARWPALPVLSSRLSPGAVICVDDARRKGGAEMLRRWVAASGWTLRVVPTQRGTAILERAPGAGPATPHSSSGKPRR